MNEREWVKSIIGDLEQSLQKRNKNLKVKDGFRLPYSSEIIMYTGENPSEFKQIGYETDILVYEIIEDDKWKPRIVIEAKINSVTTHDAITYSQKAQSHKNIHPYLRYGILLGNMNVTTLPGRLFRHGQHFDFMQSWKGFKAESEEWDGLIEILENEIETSKVLEEIIYNSRMKSRDKYTVLHRPLLFKCKITE
jgi:hypothetical protein